MNRPRVCPRCSECADGENRHHWLEDGGVLTGLACKHCPAIAVECCACAGTGEGEDEEGNQGGCPECDGLGYAEVVKISLEEIEALKKVVAE